MTQKNSILLPKLKELAAEAEDDEEIVSNLITQSESDNSNESRYQIITNSTAIVSPAEVARQIYATSQEGMPTAFLQWH